MKQTDRIVFFIIGFTIGTFLVSIYFENKSLKKEQAEEKVLDAWSQLDDDVPKLPNSLPDVFLKGTLIASGTLINENGEEEKIWIMEFKSSYPFVRIVENISQETLELMAADQILIHLKEGIDVTDVQPMLKALDLNVRMFNRDKNIIVISVLNRELDAIPQTTHGGSMRYVLKRFKNEDNESLKKIFNYEDKNNLNKIDSCLEFKKNCEISKDNITNKIKSFKDKGKTICGYAATSKSTTILNYCNIGTNYIDFICDTTKEKIGKFSPGKHIPIKDMNYFHENMTDCVYLFAWNHKEEIFNKEKNFRGEWFSHVNL